MEVGHRLAVRLLFLSGLILGLMLPTPSAGAQPPRAEAAKGEWIVVSPTPGERIGATHAIKIVVQARDGLFALQARLNGHSISREFGSSHAGRRTAKVSASHGLRHGRNVLRVKVKRRNGKWRRTTTTFFITHRLPLAGAGRDRPITVGATTTLRSTVRRPPGSGAPSSRALSYRWKLIRAPRKSSFRKLVGKSSASVRRAGILSGLPSGALNGPPTSPISPTPAFTPDALGSYTFSLTVDDGGGSTSDKVTLNAVPPTPLVQVDTMARDTDGTPGIKVGSDLYRADAGTPQNPPWFQVLVLDRRTLGLVMNKTFVCNLALTDSGFCVEDEMRDYLAGLPNTDLVIMSNHGLPSWRPPGYLSSWNIGITPRRAESLPNTGVGTFSAIGVPGLPAGQADAKVVVGGQPGSGRMTGYFTRDQYFNYTWLPPERPEFDTRQAGGCIYDSQNSFSCDNTLMVGGRQFHPTFPYKYQVEVFDGHTLDHVDSGSFRGFGTEPLNQMHDFLTKVAAGNLVMIVSVQGLREPALDPNGDNGAANRLAQAVASVGGTRNLFLRSGTAANNANYSLVGWAGAGEGNGVETSPQKDPQPGDGRLRGVLVRNHDQLYRPTDTSAANSVPTALTNLVVQQPSGSWPLDDSPSAQNAITWIGSQEDLKSLGSSDVRSAYWTQGFDQAAWSAIAHTIETLKYPGNDVSRCTEGDAGFCEEDFNAAQAELVREIGMVGKVRSYMTALAAPFNGALSSWDDLQAKVTNPVKDAVNPPKDKARAVVAQAIQAVLAAAGSAAGPATGVPSKILSFGVNLIMQAADGTDLNQLQGNADELSSQLKDRFEEAAADSRQMGDIIVSDYAKLQTVATNQRCNPTDPSCPPEWQFTPEIQRGATTGIWKGIEGSFSKAILPLAFSSWYLGPSTGRTDPRGDYQCGVFSLKVFQNAGGHSFTAALDELPPQYDVYAMANLNSIDLLNRIPTTPPEQVTSRMFGALGTSLDPKQGGLGIYPPDFFRVANRGVGDFQRPYRGGQGGYPDSCAWH